MILLLVFHCSAHGIWLISCWWHWRDLCWLRGREVGLCCCTGCKYSITSTGSTASGDQVQYQSKEIQTILVLCYPLPICLGAEKVFLEEHIKQNNLWSLFSFLFFSFLSFRECRLHYKQWEISWDSALLMVEEYKMLTVETWLFLSKLFLLTGFINDWIQMDF